MVSRDRSASLRRDAARVHLRRLTGDGAGEIEHWFDHPFARAYLGDRSWIHREVVLLAQRPGTVHRGARVLRSYGWIVLDHAEVPVAYIGGDVYDRWVRYHGESADGPILSGAEHRAAMALTYLVDPARWRRGYGRAALGAVLDHPEVADVEIFFLGIDVANHASRALAEAAGFTLDEPAPDFEDMLYYRRDRQSAPLAAHRRAPTAS
ncbi:GNAT family N-acetyltransferase [Actinospica sp. MGRD01-02]|uniref:GNAT family N-acetyltransferase n=1 Tax=Actinospica acidithermotolerans TaxID=2828514 RepID=A0A941EEW3_9ACTN|nr:GNAT family protein [Actinospica acidithermotolerans]MBR7827784.1 GNAT family N-acetyltransferase [Actinospica acidithermotolerans]